MTLKVTDNQCGQLS